MEKYVTNLKEPFVCKKRDALCIKINVWIDQKASQKGVFFTIMNDCLREFLYVSFILPHVK